MRAENRPKTYLIYSIDSFNSSSNKFDFLFLASFNLRSISKNFDVFFSSYNSKLYIKLDVIILTETKISEKKY